MFRDYFVTSISFVNLICWLEKKIQYGYISCPCIDVSLQIVNKTVTKTVTTFPANISYSYAAVSYTHLDVYKRQV